MHISIYNSIIYRNVGIIFATTREKTGPLIMMDCRKMVQALAYFASKQPKKEIDSWKAYKLLWIADRYHLRQYGRMITGDTYYALPHGPVPTDAKNLVDGEPLHYLAANQDYVDRYIKVKSKNKYRALEEPDLKVFSESDVDAMDKAYKEYGTWNCRQLEAFSHRYPDWKVYQDLISNEGEKDAHPIDVRLFFQNPEHDESPLFNRDSPELLALTQDLYFQYHRA